MTKTRLKARNGATTAGDRSSSLLPRLLLVGDGRNGVSALHADLMQRGFICGLSQSAGETGDPAPDLALVAIGKTPEPAIEQLRRRLKSSGRPVIALVAPGVLDTFEVAQWDDFIVPPFDIAELILRIGRLLRTSGDKFIVCGDLVIDPDRYEVTVAGRLVLLTFREYELLKFLASTRGRVFTRGVLLDRVWGEDYYGGDRTVDVHIRRLRSKLEDSAHVSIETVRNIGYRLNVADTAP